jgi:hypothetical protein
MNTNFNLTAICIIFSINLVSGSTLAFSATNQGVSSNGGGGGSSFQELLAEIFDLGSGIFAAIILIISLIAYRKLKSWRILLISSAFALFCARSVLSRLDVFMPETLELILAMVSFAGVILFFLAILQMGKLWLRNPFTR